VITEQQVSGGGQRGHSHCLLCGEQNPLSARLHFIALDDGSVRATFHARKELQGYDGILHGGVICALLDAAMTHCLFHKGVQAVTGEMNIRFQESIPCHATIEARARMVSARAPLFWMEAELVTNNTIKARATAKFMKRQESRS